MCYLFGMCINYKLNEGRDSNPVGRDENQIKGYNKVGKNDVSWSGRSQLGQDPIEWDEYAQKYYLNNSIMDNREFTYIANHASPTKLP